MSITPEDALKWGSLAWDLGVAIVKAVQSGQTHRTVEEIFTEVTKDMDELDRLELVRFGPEDLDELALAVPYELRMRRESSRPWWVAVTGDLGASDDDEHPDDDPTVDTDG